MKHILLLLSVWSFITSCSSLPQIYPAGDAADPLPARACRGSFPEGDWQLLHSIEATLPGGRKGFLMGLTVISSTNRTARCVIMTLEGFVVFDALYDKKISIQRAIEPFDSEEFTNGLMADIDLIFFKPSGSLLSSGFLKNGAAVCRYQQLNGRKVDIIRQDEHRWEIRMYLPDNRLVRTVTSISAAAHNSDDRQGIADKIELKAHGSPGYALVMELVEAVPVDR